MKGRLLLRLPWLLIAVLAGSSFSCPSPAIAESDGQSLAPCVPPVSSIGSRVVDAHAIKWLLTNESTTNGHNSTPVTVAWVPHHDELIVTWRGSVDSKAAETQLIAAVDIKDGACHTLAAGFEPVVAPDGSQIAYISRASGAAQIYVMDVDGSHVRQLTNRKGGVVGQGFGLDPAPLAWSPDSRRLAYVTHHYLYAYGTSMATVGGERVRVYSSEHAGSTNIASEPIAPEVRTIDLATSVDRLAVQAGADTWVTWVGWSPNGRIFFDEGHYFHTNDYNAIVSFDPASRKTSEVVHLSGMQKKPNPTFVNDGADVAYLADPIFKTYDIVDDFTVTNLHDRTTSYWTKDFRWLSRFMPQWDPRTRAVYLGGLHNSVYAHVYRLQRGHEPELIVGDAEDVKTFAFSKERRMIAWVGLDPWGQLRLRVAKEDGSSPRTLMRLHPELDGLKMSRIEEIHYRSRDGLELPALIVYPANYDPRRRYPTIVQIHGGGFSSLFIFGGTIVWDTGPLEWQYWASLGYAMVLTDYRITGTYGHKPVQDAIANHDWYERDCDDIEGAVDYAIAHGIADPNRLGVFGQSYGGTHTNFLITHDHRYRAAISYEGWGNEITHYASALVPGDRGSYLFGGHSWTVPQTFIRESSVFHMNGVRTATIFVSGNPDLGSEPREDNNLMYATFRDQGVPSELLQYEKAGHGLVDVGDNMDLLSRSTAWFDQYLKHAKGSAPRS
jgi:dipeptidyl aminopeptidase/acylaminoacyl peptidase